MYELNIMLAIFDNVYSKNLKSFLQTMGLNVIDTSKDSNDCLRKVRMLRPDLLIIDYDLKPINGFNVAKIIDEDNISSGMLLLNDGQKSQIEQDVFLNNFIYLLKPLSKNVLLTSIELFKKSNIKIKALKQEIEDLRESLEARKNIEKAKGLLMNMYKISEQEAFRLIQKRSMDKGISMKEIAEAIIIAHDIK